MKTLLHGLHGLVWLFWLVVLAVAGGDLAINGAHPQLGLVSISSGGFARLVQFGVEIFSSLAAATLLLALALRLPFVRQLAWSLGLLCLLGAAFAVLAGLVIGLPRAPVFSFSLLLALAGLLTIWASHWRFKPTVFTGNSVPAAQTDVVPPP